MNLDDTDLADVVRRGLDVPLERWLLGRSVPERLAAVEALEQLRHSESLYARVRACALLAALHRFHLPLPEAGGDVPWEAWRRLQHRALEPALAMLRARFADRPTRGLSVALAVAYRRLCFATLAEQVQRSVRDAPGNRWLFDPQAPEPVTAVPWQGTRSEHTPVRMDLSHAGWSDIFFLAMDRPQWARVINASIDLAPHGRTPAPPVQVTLERIDAPVLELHSQDLGESVRLTRIGEVFDMGADHLGLLRAAVIAAGWVPPHLQGQDGPLAPWLARLLGRGGLRLHTWVRDIPKGSRLAVSTSLLAGIIAALMRISGQAAPQGGLSRPERRLVASRAILGEWLGGSGGGWQDSGGLWPGFKRIEGVPAGPGSPEHGISRGRLLPRHIPLLVTPTTEARLLEHLVLFHGGMAQDVGPVLQQVTEGYLLRRQLPARQEALTVLAEAESALLTGDIDALARATEANYRGPLRRILPWAANAYADDLGARLRQEFSDDYLGFWMLGGMAGGGMGCWVRPVPGRGERIEAVLEAAWTHWRERAPFAIAPLRYAVAINHRGSWGAHQPVPAAVVAIEPPGAPTASGTVDAVRHERLRAAVRAGTIGLAANRLTEPLADAAVDAVVTPADVPVAPGELLVYTLAAGKGSRWSQGADVVKALSPVGPAEGTWPSFLALQCANARGHPHVVSLARAVPRVPGLVQLVAPVWGRRLVPTVRDLEHHFYGQLHAVLDAQAEHVRQSGWQALLGWARARGEASDYDDPRQALHPAGHLFELFKLLTSGVLLEQKRAHPTLRTVLMRNLDALGATPDAAVLAAHRATGRWLGFEVMPRRAEDGGGSLATLQGRRVIIEGPALPDEADAFTLGWSSANTSWVDIDPWLAALGLDWADLEHPVRAAEAVRDFTTTLPAIAVIKQVRRNLGGGHEDLLPVLQIEQLWGDVTRVWSAGFLGVPRTRGAQLKSPADRDDWWRDGSAAVAFRAWRTVSGGSDR